MVEMVKIAERTFLREGLDNFVEFIADGGFFVNLRLKILKDRVVDHF
jgi:hypothetical protein